MNEKNGILPFVLGGLVGAAVALLYAPRPGDETRTALLENGRVVRDKALDSIYEVQTRVGTLTQESKKRLGELQEIGRHTLEEQKQSLRTGLRQAKEVVAGNGTNGSSDNGLY